MNKKCKQMCSDISGKKHLIIRCEVILNEMNDPTLSAKKYQGGDHPYF